MNSARQQEKLAGQTSIARKVFEMVPIQEAWTATQIRSHIERTTHTRMDSKILNGCLTALIDGGLVRQYPSGMYSRTKVSDERSNVAAGVEDSVPVNGPEPISPQGPIEILSTISARVVAVSEEIKRIAADIEHAALVIEEGIAKNSENLEKLKQLQSLLKSLT